MDKKQQTKSLKDRFEGTFQIKEVKGGEYTYNGYKFTKTPENLEEVRKIFKDRQFLVYALPAIEAEVFRKYFGLEDGEFMSMTDIAKSMNVTKTTVSKYLSRALYLLDHSSFSTYMTEDLTDDKVSECLTKLKDEEDKKPKNEHDSESIDSLKVRKTVLDELKAKGFKTISELAQLTSKEIQQIITTRREYLSVVIALENLGYDFSTGLSYKNLNYFVRKSEEGKEAYQSKMKKDDSLSV